MMTLGMLRAEARAFERDGDALGRPGGAARYARYVGTVGALYASIWLGAGAVAVLGASLWAHPVATLATAGAACVVASVATGRRRAGRGR